MKEYFVSYTFRDNNNDWGFGNATIFIHKGKFDVDKITKLISKDIKNKHKIVIILNYQQIK